MRPAIMTDRAHSFIELMEGSGRDTLVVTKNVGARQIHVDGRLAGWVVAGKWTWRNYANTRFHKEELQATADSVNGI